MPDDEETMVMERARKDAREGKSPSTQSGEFVREEMEHVREGKHGARSPQQAIAIGLSKARRAGVKLAPPKKGSAKIKRQAERDLKRGMQRHGRKLSPRRSRATMSALKREGRSAASRASLSRRAKQVAKKRGPQARSKSARKSARTRARERRAA
jgi:hypothetical protein